MAQPTPPASSGSYHDVYAAAGGRGGQVGPAGRQRALPSARPQLELLPRNVHGRDDLKAALAPILTRPDGRLRVLHGIGGGGKSAIGLWLIRQAQDHGVDTYWIKGNDVAGAMLSVAIERGMDPERVLRAAGDDVSATNLVWDELAAATRPWLLVFDNVDDVHRPGLLGAAPALLDGTGWIRACPAGTVVVTSRRGDAGVWGERAVLHHVACLSDEAGARILTDLAPKAGSVQDAARLASRLGGLPLALRLAGSYLREPLRLATFSDYHDAVEPALLDTAEDWSPTDDEAARRCVRTTWELSLRMLDDRGITLARPLLQVLTCLGAPHPIRIDMLEPEPLRTDAFTHGVALEGPVLDQALRNLVSYALVDRVNLPAGERQTGTRTLPALALHPLVAEVVGEARDRSQHRDEIWRAAVALLVKAVPEDSDDPATWPSWQAVPDVAASVARRVPAELTDELATAVQCVTASAGHLLVTGRMRQPHELSALALKRAGELPPRHEAWYRARFAAAVVNQAEGNAATVREELMHLLEDVMHDLDGTSPFVVTIRQFLADAMRTTGELDIAEDLYDGLLADHAGSIDGERLTRFGYGQLLIQKGEHVAAEKEIQFVLDIERSEHGDDDPRTLATRAIMAQIWTARGRFSDARAELEAVLAKQEELFGADSPATLATRVILLGVLAGLSDDGGADAQLGRLLRIQHDALDPENPLALLGLAALVSARSTRGDNDPREDSQRLEALASAMADKLGDTSPDVVRIRLSAAAQRHLFDPPGAEAAVDDLLADQLAEYGPTHPMTSHVRLVRVQMLVSDDEDNPFAEGELRELLDAQSESAGPDHPQTLVITLALANIVFRNGDPRESKHLMEQALAASSRLRGHSHVETQQIRTTFVTVLCKLQEYDAAEQQLVTLIDLSDDVDGMDALGARVMLALVRADKGLPADAEAGLRGVREVLGQGHPEAVADILFVDWILSDLLRDRGEFGEAEGLLAPAVKGLDEMLTGTEGERSAILARIDLAELLHERGRVVDAERVAQLAMTRIRASDALDDEDRDGMAGRVGRLLELLASEVVEVPVDAPPPPEAARSDGDQPAVAEGGWLEYLSGTAVYPSSAAPVTTPGRQAAARPAPVVSEPAPRPAPHLRPPLSELMERFEQARRQHVCGRLDEAEHLVRDALQAAPRDQDRVVVEAELIGWYRERAVGWRADADLADEVRRQAADARLPEWGRARLELVWARVLADQGFPVAARAGFASAAAQLCRLPDQQPLLVLECRISASAVHPEPGGEDATRELTMVVDKASRDYGPDHPLTLESRSVRGTARLICGDHLAAEEELRAVLEQQDPGTDPSRLTLQVRTALVRAARGRTGNSQAEAALRTTVDRLTPHLGADHPQILSALAALAAQLADRSSREGSAALADVLVRQLRRRGPRHPDIAATRHELGVVAAAVGDRAEARRQLSAAVNIRRRRFGSAHPQVRDGERFLVRL